MYRKLFPIFCYLLMTMVAKSQQVPVSAPPPEQKTIISAEGDTSTFSRVEVEAQFPGDHNAWASYLRQNLDANVPVRKRAAAGIYKVIVRFIVSRDGSISNVMAETNHGHGMEKEVMRIIKKGPKWIPALKDGRAVNAYRRQPVTFVVSELAH